MAFMIGAINFRNRPGRSTVGLSPVSVPPHTAICADIHNYDDYSQNHLDVGSESCRIDKRHGIMFDKSSRISGLPAGLTEPVLQGREGADPSPKLQGGSPDSGGKMDPWNPTPPQSEPAPYQHKHNEAEMDEKDKVNQDSPKHERFQMVKMVLFTIRM